MKRILVPTDFSTLSQASYKFALELATKIKADIFVVHMIQLPMLQETTFGIQPALFDPALVKDMDEQAHQAFEQMIEKYPSTVSVNFLTIQNDVLTGIRSFIDENEIDLVIMNTHNTSGLEGFFNGTMAEKIVRFSFVPRIAIPKDISFNSIKNIVFPNTLELDQEDLVVRLKELQSIFQATLHILLINTPSNFSNDEKSMKLLERFANHYNLQNFTLNYRNHHEESEGILTFLKEIKGDMIAMATHGRKGLVHLIKGSIAESVLNHTDHPLWTCKTQT